MALPTLDSSSQLTQVDAAQPIRGDLKLKTFFPLAFPKVFLSIRRRRLRDTHKWPQRLHPSASRTLVIAQAVDIDHLGRSRIRTDKNLQALPGFDTGMGAKTLDLLCPTKGDLCPGFIDATSIRPDFG